MAASADPLVRDLLAWVASEPRSYRDVLDAWKTSCPRLTIWEDANDAGLVERQSDPKTGDRVEVPAKKIPFFKPSKELKDLVNTGEGVPETTPAAPAVPPGA